MPAIVSPAARRRFLTTSAVKLGLPLQVQLQVLLGLAASSIDAWVSLAAMKRYSKIPMKMALHSAAIKQTCAAC